MLLPVRFREQLTQLGHKLLENLEGMSSSFSSLFTIEHKPTGAHGDITADSITVAGIPTVAVRVISLTGKQVINNTNTAELGTGTIVDAIADGDIIRFVGSMSVVNNTGSDKGFENFLDIGGTQVSLGGGSTAWADGTDRDGGVDLTLFRQGLTIYVSGWFDRTAQEASFTPGLTAGRPLKLQINLTAASNNLHVTLNRGLLLHYRQIG